MLGRTADPGTVRLINICTNACGLKGRNGHKYGAFNVRTLAKNKINNVLPIINPGTLKMLRKATKIVLRFYLPHLIHNSELQMFQLPQLQHIK